MRKQLGKLDGHAGIAKIAFTREDGKQGID
jgi:hypothetical protein